MDPPPPCKSKIDLALDPPKMFISYLNEDPFEYALQIGFNPSLLYIFTLKNYIF